MENNPMIKVTIERETFNEDGKYAGRDTLYEQTFANLDVPALARFLNSEHNKS